MAALVGWTFVPIAFALIAAALIALRARVLFASAALDGRAFAQALRACIASGDFARAHALAAKLRPAWAAEVAFRVTGPDLDARERGFLLDEGWAEFLHQSQRGLLAIRALGRLALPLALAVAIVELAQGFDPAKEAAWGRAAATSAALARGLFACVTGLCTSIACQISANTLARAAKQRLDEVRHTCDSLRANE
jgi:biopolymer transport protein ExbB/TolQ